MTIPVTQNSQSITKQELSDHFIDMYSVAKQQSQHIKYIV